MPVVRLTGVIGVATPLRPGLMLSTAARTLERAFGLRNARAVALLINSPGGSPAQSHLIFRRIRQLAEEKKIPVHRLHRGRRRFRRLHAGLRRRRDHLRPLLDRRLDRRGRRLLRLPQADGQARHRAAHLYLGRAQGDARSVPAGEAGGRQTPQGDPEGHPRALHRAGQGAARRAAQGRRQDAVLRRVLDRAERASSSALPTASATCARPCASASATRCARR